MSRSRLRGGAEAGRFRGGLPEKKLKEEKGQGSGGGVVGCRGRGGRLKDGETNVATGAAVLAKAARRSGTWRRWGSRGRAAGSQLESFLQTFPGHHPIPSAQKITSPPQPSAELRGEEGEVGPCSASTLRLPLEKSSRVKHDLHQEEKNQYHQRVGGEGGLYLTEMFGRGGGAFPTKAQDATLASSRGSAIATPALAPPSPAPRGCSSLANVKWSRFALG